MSVYISKATPLMSASYKRMMSLSEMTFDTLLSSRSTSIIASLSATLLPLQSVCFKVQLVEAICASHSLMRTEVSVVGALH